MSGKDMERAFKRIEEANELIALVSGWGIVVVAFALFGSALSRYVLRFPIGASVEFATILFFLLTLLGMAYTLQVGGHINFVLVLERLTGRVRRRVELISAMVSLLIFVLMATGGWLMFWRSAVSGWNTTDMGWPFSAFQWALPVGLALLSVEGLIVVLRHAFVLLSGGNGSR